MNFRLAKKTDLPLLKVMYEKIVANMKGNGIALWNEFYSYDEFELDIENSNLHLLTNDSDIVAAFAICNNTLGEDAVLWQDTNAKAAYLARIGVNINYLGQGAGSIAIKRAVEIAKNKNAQYLRLLVAEVNVPAIKFYRKQGFKQVEGYFDEVILSQGTNLIEYGYELKIK